MTTQTPIHISDRFFAKAARYFGDLKTALSELIQNAYRASLPILESGQRPRVEITLSPGCVEIRDFGIGIQDVGAALSIAVSNWDPSVEEEQDPAGMGLCAALAFSASTTLRSQFGELTVEGHRFFTDPAYRAELLDRIQPNPLDFGTSIILTGPKDGSESSCVSSLEAMLESVCYYHCAIDVFIRTTTAEGLTPWKRIENLTSKWLPKRDPKTKEPVLYRGYPVLERQGYGYSYAAMSPSRCHVGILWHGHLIEVRLQQDALRREIRLPTGDKVRVHPQLPIAAAVAIVIDHGTAPVTPKLPDRTSLILDEKTADFIWGFVGPQMEAAIEERFQWMSEMRKTYPVDSALPVRQITDIVEGRVPAAVEAALYRHFFDAVPFTLPAWGGSGHCTLDKVFCTRSTPRTLLAPGVVLHTSDNRYFAVPCGGEIEDNAAQLNFARPRRLNLVDVEICDSGAAIPEGVAAGYEEFHGLRPCAPAGMLVVDIPMTFAECTYTREWARDLRVKQFLPSSGPLNARVYHFVPRLDPELDDPAHLSERHDEVNEYLSSGEREVTYEIDTLLAAADEVTSHTLAGIVICTDDSGNDPGDLVWIGDRDSLIDTSFVMNEILSEYEWDEEPDIRRQEVDHAFSAIRHALGAAAEISPELVKITEKCGGYIKPDKIRRVTMNAENGEIAIEHLDGHGDVVTRISKFTLA